MSTVTFGGTFARLPAAPFTATFGGTFSRLQSPPFTYTFGGTFARLAAELDLAPDCFIVWGGARVPARMRVVTATGRYP